MHTYIHIHTYIQLLSCIHTHTKGFGPSVESSIHTCIHAYIHIHSYIYVHAYIHIQRASDLVWRDPRAELREEFRV